MINFEVAKKYNLLDWHTLIIGLKENWIDSKCFICYAEFLLENSNNETNEINEILISIISENLSKNDLIDECIKIFNINNNPLTEDKINLSYDKFRLFYMKEIIDNKEYSEQNKIDFLQEVYSQFGFPEDMASCSIYNCDGVDPLNAAQKVIQQLTSKIASRGD
jgi:hypothetical protein